MIVKNKREEFESYLEDTSNFKGDASLLYMPANIEEVIEAVTECVKKKLPLTVSGGRTGTAAGSTPLGGAIISLEKLKKIIDIDEKEKSIHLEAGVSLEEIECTANKLNLSLRASPTESLAFIGGAVSTSASGVRGFGYGSIRPYVLAITVILPQAEVVTFRRADFVSGGRVFDFDYQGRRFNFGLPSYNMPKVKSQAGYFIKDDMDLVDLFIGSEGTLGIIVACQIALQQVPFCVFDGLVFFNKENEALNFVDKIKLLKRNNLSGVISLEFFDRNSLELLKPEYPFVPHAEAAVYFEQECRNEKEHSFLIEKWAVLIEEYGASLDISLLADTPKEREKIFKFRHRLPQLINEFLRQHKQIKAATDIAVPCENFREMYNFYMDTAKESGLEYVNFGHIGESHLHFNFLPKSDSENLEAKKYLKIFCEKAVSLGGTVSAEHGIGKIKKPYLKIMYDGEQIREMAALKKYFDPYCLVGLDNIFEKELLFKI